MPISFSRFSYFGFWPYVRRNIPAANISIHDQWLPRFNRSRVHSASCYRLSIICDAVAKRATRDRLRRGPFIGRVVRVKVGSVNYIYILFAGLVLEYMCSYKLLRNYNLNIIVLYYAQCGCVVSKVLIRFKNFIFILKTKIGTHRRVY